MDYKCGQPGWWVSVNSVYTVRQRSERHFQRISSAPYFEALKGTYLHSITSQLLSLGSWLISLFFLPSFLFPEHFKARLNAHGSCYCGGLVPFFLPELCKIFHFTAAKPLTKRLVKVKMFMFPMCEVENLRNLLLSPHLWRNRWLCCCCLHFFTPKMDTNAEQPRNENGMSLFTSSFVI